VKRGWGLPTAVRNRKKLVGAIDSEKYSMLFNGVSPVEAGRDHKQKTVG